MNVEPVLVFVISSIGCLLPRPLGNLRVGRGQIRPGDVQIGDAATYASFLECRSEGFAFVLGAKAVLFAGDGVLGIKDARPAEQNESRFHGWFSDRETSPLSSLSNTSFGEAQWVKKQ